MANTAIREDLRLGAREAARTLDERGEWLTSRDIREVFSVGKTTANKIMNEAGAVHVLSCKRVSRKALLDWLREQD